MKQLKSGYLRQPTQVTPKQKAWLRTEAYKTNKSISAIIRNLIQQEMEGGDRPCKK